MVRFQGGEADGVALRLESYPVFMRVVREPNTKDRKQGLYTWDALNSTADACRATETPFAYIIKAAPLWTHTLSRDPKLTGWRVVADYLPVINPPTDAVMRNETQWQEWCEMRVFLPEPGDNLKQLAKQFEPIWKKQLSGPPSWAASLVDE